MILHTVLCLLLIFNIPVQTDGKTTGSTPYLKTIILGRCTDYLVVNKAKYTNMKPSDCDTLWKKFHDSFAFKDPCNLTFADYEPFFDAVKGRDIKDKAMFWSGTKEAVHYYSYFDLRFTTLEDTFVGSMMDGLRWCGNPSLPRNTTDGIDYQSCPNCNSRITAFWGLASKRFAERTRGIVRVMVNGTRDKPAYVNTSFFGKYELPNLRVHNISELIIIVVHTIGKEPIEKCGTKSVKQLEIDARARGLKVKCVNDPDAVKHVLCIDHSRNEECLFYNEKPNGKRVWEAIAIAFIAFSAVLLVVLIVVICFYCKKKRKNVDNA